MLVSFLSLRYASDTFGNISKHELMSYKELKEHLGVDPDSSYLLFTPTPKPPRQTSKTDKLLSFLSDSCYLTPGGPTNTQSTNHSPLFSLSDSESTGSSSNSRAKHSEHGHCLEISSNLIEQFDTHCLSSPSSPNRSHFNLSPSEFEGLPVSSPYSPSCCSSQSLTINPSASGFPQPLFSECDLSSSSSLDQESPTLQTQEKTVELFSPNSVMASGVGNVLVSSDYSGACIRVPFVQDEMMDTVDGTVPSPQGLLTSHISLKKTLQSQGLTDQNTPFETRPLIRQGAEETPFEPDVPLHGLNLAAKQKLVSDTLKAAESLSEQCMVNGRVALKPLKVDNVVSPVRFYGDKKSSQSEECTAGQFLTDISINGAVNEGQVSRKRKQGRRKNRVTSRK